MSREDGWMKHEIARRLVECRCGWKGTPREFEDHFHEEVRAAARRVIRRSFQDIIEEVNREEASRG